MSGSITNTFLNPDMITKRALPLFVNTNAFLKNIDRQYSDQFARTGAKIGDNLRIRLPSDFTVTSGPSLSPQSITQINTNLTVSNQEHVDIVITSADLALKVEEFDDLILKPAMNRLAGQVASDVMSLVNTIPNVSAYFSSGTTVGTPNQRALAGAKAQLLNNSATDGDMIAVMSPTSMANISSQFSGLFNPTGRISEMFDSGEVVGPAFGIQKFMNDQLVPVVTTGGNGALPTINGSGQTGTTLTVTAATSGASLNVGDIITIAGVNAVNRVTHTSTGQLRTFVVTAAYTGGTGTTLSIYPALTPLGSGGADAPFATVNTSPASGAQISVVLAGGQTITKNFVMKRNAFTLATVDLPMYDKGVVDAARENYDGISMRCLRTYYPQTDQLILRLDVLYGYAALRPEWACVVPDIV
ncbi:MAG: hypothetical protein KGO02_10915 [Alphaproteobacteria bacterium]|nr:hypothetical protein [Alphaproteobacteria bacterium]